MVIVSMVGACTGSLAVHFDFRKVMAKTLNPKPYVHAVWVAKPKPRHLVVP